MYHAKQSIVYENNQGNLTKIKVIFDLKRSGTVVTVLYSNSWKKEPGILVRLPWDCEACKRGIAQPLVQQTAIDVLSCADFDVLEITFIVNSDYFHIAENPEKNAPSKAQNRLKVHLIPSFDNKANDEETETADE